MKIFAIRFVALLAVATARSVTGDVDGNEPNSNDDRIMGGELTTIEQHPHTVSLRESSYHTCGGSIISPNRALTSTRCLNRNLPASEYSIMVGATSYDGGAHNQTRQLTRFLLHEQYNTPLLSNDIAMLFWEEPLTFNAYVQAIRLPVANAPVPYGENATLTGWGENGEKKYQILRSLTKPLISNEECNNTLPGWIQPDMICSQGVIGRGACERDSGGPLVHNNTLIGISSWSLGLCASGAPEVYTRVASLIDWINHNSE